MAMAAELVDTPLDLDHEMPVVPVSASHDQVDLQIATAHRFPRSVARFRDRALSMATIDEETAAGCFYCVPRDGKNIEGPSVRLAEIVLSCWGNLRAEAAVVEEGEKLITAEGMVWDLETNVAIKMQVKRRITKRNGARYSDDMIVTAGNAAASIALRNATFRVIPMVYVKEIERKAKVAAIGKAETLGKRRGEMVTYFSKMGVGKERLCGYVGKDSIDDMTLEDVFTLRGVANAIRDGATSIDAVFPEAKSGNGKESADDLKKRLAQPAAAEPKPLARGDLTPEQINDLRHGAEACGLPGLALQSTLQSMFAKSELDQLTQDEGKRLRQYIDTKLD